MKTAILPIILCLVTALSLLTACERRSTAEQAAQIAGDVLSPEGRLREATVARQATAAAEAAAATAARANELAQANLDAAKKAQADAQQATIEAKAEAAKAATALKAIEASLPPATPAPTPK